MSKDKPTATGVIPDRFSLLLRVSPLILICIVGVVVYSNSFSGSFHLDDFRYIVHNEGIRDIGDIDAIRNTSRMRRLVGYYSFALNYHIHQDDLFGYHLTNLFIHIGSSLFVWWLVLLILSTPVMRKQPFARHRRFIALACGLLFLSHPVQTQAVTYIYQRLASLATFFYLASFSLYMNARLTQKKHVSLICFTLSVLSAVLGMFTKEIVFTLPFVILLFDLSLFYGVKRLTLKNWKGLIPLFFLLATAFLFLLSYSSDIRWFLNPQMSHNTRDPQITLGIHLMTQFRVLLTYIRLLFIPVNQNLDYDFAVSRSFFEPDTFFSFLALVAIFIAAIRLFPKKRLLSLGILWFFLTLSVESLIPLRDIIFEHRLYLPMFGFTLFFVGVLYEMLGRKHPRMMTGIMILVIIVFGALTYRRNTVWRDEYTLWSDVVAKSPNKARPLNNLGNYLYQQGRYEEAVAVYKRAIASNPGYPEIYGNLGTILFYLGKPDESVQALRTAISMDSTNARMHYNLGYIWYAEGEMDNAIAEYQAAIANNPAYTEAYYNLGLAYQSSGEWDRAAGAYRHVVKLSPSYFEAYYHLGIVLKQQGMIEEAAREFLQVIALNSDHINAHVQLAACYRELGNEGQSKIHEDIADSLRNSSQQ